MSGVTRVRTRVCLAPGHGSLKHGAAVSKYHVAAPRPRAAVMPSPCEHNATTSQLPRHHPRPPRDVHGPPCSSQLRPYDGRAMATPPGSCHVTTTTPAPCSSAAERRGPLRLGVPGEAWRAAGLCPHAAPQDLGLPKQQEAGRPHCLLYVSQGVAVEGLKHPASAPRRKEASDGPGGGPLKMLCTLGP